MSQYCFAGCRLSSSSVGRLSGAWERGVGTLPAAGRVDGRAAIGRHCTAGQSCYVPLGRHLVYNNSTRFWAFYHASAWQSYAQRDTAGTVLQSLPIVTQFCGTMSRRGHAASSDKKYKTVNTHIMYALLISRISSDLSDR